VNAHRGAGNDGDDPPSQLSDLDDEGLLAALREVLRAADPPPQWSVELAKASFGLRMADAELAALASDSQLAGARAVTRGASAPWLAVFDSGHLTVEIEVIPHGPVGRSWQALGQLTPAAAATITIRRQRDAAPAQGSAGGAQVAADELGRFAIGQLAPGPLSLAIKVDGRRPVITDWIALS
jgi:hypothetical protein